MLKLLPFPRLRFCWCRITSTPSCGGNTTSPTACTWRGKTAPRPRWCWSKDMSPPAGRRRISWGLALVLEGNRHQRRRIRDFQSPGPQEVCLVRRRVQRSPNARPDGQTQKYHKQQLDICFLRSYFEASPFSPWICGCKGDLLFWSLLGSFYFVAPTLTLFVFRVYQIIFCGGEIFYCLEALFDL